MDNAEVGGGNFLSHSLPESIYPQLGSEPADKQDLPGADEVVTGYCEGTGIF